jgi:hypothetical protein
LTAKNLQTFPLASLAAQLASIPSHQHPTTSTPEHFINLPTCFEIDQREVLATQHLSGAILIWVSILPEHAHFDEIDRDIMSSHQHIDTHINTLTQQHSI